MNPNPASPGGKATAQDWDQARKAFHTSLMVDTTLAALAQNAGTADWPLPGAGETPAKYIDLTFAELQLLPELEGQPERIGQLIEILRATMAFDEPFGDMVAQTEAAAQKDNPLTKNLARLQIPTSYPIAWTLLSAETKDFCRLEKLQTLGEFAGFAQSMSQTIIVGGDFRRLLNALASTDESALAELLPFRPGAKGLHLPEALAQALAARPRAEQLALGRHYGRALAPAEQAEAAGVTREQLAAASAALREQAGRLGAWFSEEWTTLRAAGPAALPRQLVVLDDTLAEVVLAGVLAECLPAAVVAAPEEKKPRSWFGRWFKK